MTQNYIDSRAVFEMTVRQMRPAFRAGALTEMVDAGYPAPSTGVLDRIVDSMCEAILRIPYGHYLEFGDQMSDVATEALLAAAKVEANTYIGLAA